VYGFLLVSFSNIAPKTHHFWDIQFQNCRDFENRVRGPSRSLEMSPRDRAHMTFYSNYGSISCRFWDIQCWKCRDLEIGVKSQSRSLRVVSFDILWSLVTFSLKCTVFQIFDFKNAMNLKTGLGVRQGHWKCHRSTSYWRSIVTMALSRVVSGRKMSRPWNRGQRSFKVIESGTIR